MQRGRASQIDNGKQTSAMELEPANWKPLELRIGTRCSEFMWMFRENGLEHYKHIDTRRYLILDAKGRSYVRRDGDMVRVNFRKEFRRVVEASDARSVC
jgi:hypothetical protein